MGIGCVLVSLYSQSHACVPNHMLLVLHPQLIHPHVLHNIHVLHTTPTRPTHACTTYTQGYLDTTPLAHTIVPQLGAWGAAATTVHGRTRQQRYSRVADWDYIKQCASVCKVWDEGWGEGGMRVG